jgi:hypothetical protein
MFEAPIAMPIRSSASPASFDERGPMEGEVDAGFAGLLRTARILHAGRRARFGLGKIGLEQGPGALKSDTSSRRKHLQAVLPQSGSPCPYPDGRFVIQPAIPIQRLIPSRSRPPWRNPGCPGETTFQIGIRRVAVSVSRPSWRESRTTDRHPERRTGLQTNVSRRRPGYARDKPPYPSLERRIATQPVRSAR